MKKKVALYPYCAEMYPAVLYFNMLQDKYTLSRLISPLGLGINRRDAGYVCNRSDVGIMVTDSVGDFDSWDELFIAKPCYEKEISDIILESVMHEALDAGKNIEYFTSKPRDISEGARKLSEDNPGRVILQDSSKISGNINSRDRRDCGIEAPVVFVGGLVEQAGIFEVLLSLATSARGRGLHPLVIAKHPLGSCFGFHNLMHIYEDYTLPEGEKIKELNSHIRCLERETVPGIIIVEAPDALMRFNDYDPNGYGVLSYMLCQAANPDALVCCIPYEFGHNPLIDAYSKDFSHRLGCAVTAACMSNVIIDTMDLMQSRQLSYAYASVDVVMSHFEHYCKGSSIPIVSIFDDGDKEKSSSVLLGIILNNL